MTKVTDKMKTSQKQRFKEIKKHIRPITIYFDIVDYLFLAKEAEKNGFRTTPEFVRRLVAEYILSKKGKLNDFVR